ncbi:hypothetical protein [Klebsiella quasipneumoniae]|uniref:hypothetical protein n=1 Tax=Klebsiella quasipneumoniae TaxID=1463165 RepID=UPI003A95F546|nr:hypothetical protein [Klebsiella quasipneumoniae subsp. similipneumoniae]HCM7883735.1 hypothetical protein [Klebsiella quasipneumoniae]HCM8036298.1 hypothetical protein [Klebsiella quasipneumoniae]
MKSKKGESRGAVTPTAFWCKNEEVIARQLCLTTNKNQIHPDALHTAGLINPLLLKRRNSTNSGGDYV